MVFILLVLYGLFSPEWGLDEHKVRVQGEQL